MNVEEFSSVLRDSMPTAAALSSLGIDQEGISELQSRFRLDERVALTLIPVLGDPVLDALFRRFDPTSVVIGPIQFLSRPESVPGGWRIGQVESDPLIVKSETREVLVEDLARAGHILWRCARSPEHLLDALALVIPVLAHGMKTPQNKVSMKANEVDRCTSAAGGGEFHSFYEMLVG